jgi:hypothetical protein
LFPCLYLIRSETGHVTLGKEICTHDSSILILQIASLNQVYFNRIARELHKRSHRLLLPYTYIIISLFLILTHNIDAGLDLHPGHPTEPQVADSVMNGGEPHRYTEWSREGVVKEDWEAATREGIHQTRSAQPYRSQLPKIAIKVAAQHNKGSEEAHIKNPKSHIQTTKGRNNTDPHQPRRGDKTP